MSLCVLVCLVLFLYNLFVLFYTMYAELFTNISSVFLYILILHCPLYKYLQLARIVVAVDQIFVIFNRWVSLEILLSGEDGERDRKNIFWE